MQNTMKKYQIWTHYESVKGGVNNLQVSNVCLGYSVEKTFTSLKDNAEKRAEQYIQKMESPNQITLIQYTYNTIKTMAKFKKRTYMVFLTKEGRSNAIDFLLGIRAKFNYGYNPNSQGLYLLDVTPHTFKKNYLDLYLNFDNAFSTTKS